MGPTSCSGCVVVALYLLDFIDTEDMDVFYYTKTAPAQVAADFHLVCHCFCGRETNVSWIVSRRASFFTSSLSELLWCHTRLCAQALESDVWVVSCQWLGHRCSDGLVVTYARILSYEEISKHNKKKACAGWSRGRCQDVLSSPARDMASACLLP